MLVFISVFFFFFKQKTAYEMRISDWSSDVCSSDLADTDYAAGLAAGVKGVKIAYSPALGYAKVDPEIAAAVDAAAQHMAALGAIVAQVDPGFRDPVDAFHTPWYAGDYNPLMALPPQQLKARKSGVKGKRVAGRQDFRGSRQLKKK